MEFSCILSPPLSGILATRRFIGAGKRAFYKRRKKSNKAPLQIYGVSLIAIDCQQQLQCFFSTKANFFSNYLPRTVYSFLSRQSFKVSSLLIKLTFSQLHPDECRSFRRLPGVVERYRKQCITVVQFP